MKSYIKSTSSHKETQMIAYSQGTPIRITSAEQVEALEGAIQKLR